MEVTKKERRSNVAEVIEKLDPDYKKQLGIGEPVGRGQTVMFRVIKRPTETKNIKGDTVQLYGTVRVPWSDTIFDGKQLHDITIDDKVSDIRFTNDSAGIIAFTDKEPHRWPMMWYMRMSNYNRTNAAYSTAKEYLFEEIAADKEAISAVEKEKDIASLTMFILDKNTSDIRQIMDKLRLVPTDSAEANKKALIDYIKNDSNRHKFKTNTVNGNDLVLRIIKQAEKLEMIRCDSDTKIWSNQISGKKIKDIYVTPMNEDQYESLAKYFITDETGKKLRLFYETQIEKHEIDKKAKAAGQSI